MIKQEDNSKKHDISYRLHVNVLHEITHTESKCYRCVITAVHIGPIIIQMKSCSPVHKRLEILNENKRYKERFCMHNPSRECGVYPAFLWQTSA